MKRVLILGAGNFGYSWIVDVLPRCSGFAELVGVVDRNEETHKRIPKDILRFTDLDEALEITKPDLVINVTPPDLHTVLNKKLLSMNYPVLCEKPIAGNLEQLRELQEYLSQNDGFLMIGENYRYGAVFRKAREVLSAENLGKIHTVECRFRHYHPDYSQYYHGRLKHPLLTDVTIHHLDVARFLTGENPVSVSAKEWPAPYAWYGQRPANVNIISEMSGCVMFNYSGTLASPVSTTDWNADWQIECDHGVLKIELGKLSVIDEAGEREIPYIGDDDSRPAMLNEAITALKEGRKGETDISDNIYSFLWMEYAIKSSEEGRAVNFTAQ